MLPIISHMAILSRRSISRFFSRCSTRSANNNNPLSRLKIVSFNFSRSRFRSFISLVKFPFSDSKWLLNNPC